MNPALTLDIRVKEMFFDRPKVVAAVERAKLNALRQDGGTVRKIARRSIRKRKGTSVPGAPPSSHEGSLRSGIFFAYDRSSDSAVVGPVGFRRGDVPNALEFGGSVFVRNHLVPVGITKVKARNAKGRLVTKKKKRFIRHTGTLRIRPRPFMGPALQKARDSNLLLDPWKNSIRGG